MNTLVTEKNYRPVAQKLTSSLDLYQAHIKVSLTMAYMRKPPIEMPEKGTYKWQLFSYWSDEYRQTRADHSAYIALNFAGALDVCRIKLQALMQHHRQHSADVSCGARHQRAIERLQNTLSGAAMAYESNFSGG